MITTNSHSLARHLIEDLELRDSDLVFLFSGIWGLGRLENGLQDITNAFRAAIPKGVLFVPTFSYSWCNQQPWDHQRTSCPDMGIYADSVWREKEFVRSNNPNFSVAALRTSHNADLVDAMLDNDDSCFGEQSVFGRIAHYGEENRAFLLLLGGAFKDCLFRCTLIHYVQQKMMVPHRYEKIFRDPEGSGRVVTQLVRFLDPQEYEMINGTPPTTAMGFPVKEVFNPFGLELKRQNKLIQKPFGFYESRMTSVSDCIDVFTRETIKNPAYCVVSGDWS
ncbi:MAG: aminoglycoside N3-acetyltransferase [Magnetococcales bacterium]|nr:aminoglycoside N3-acetyltransferase [Magnetococcales bacterium]HIJ82740.1 hypothetical protein [Magnetococcales bacterium]